MKGETRWRLFRYLAIDHKAAQEWLNGMAALGWELERIYLGFLAKFRRTERTDLAYFLDWTDRDEAEDYLQLCSDAGWALLQTLGSLNLFAAKPGVRPLPIQTDPELEYQRFREKGMKSALFSVLSFAVILAFLLGIALLFDSPVQIIAFLLSYSNMAAFFFFSAPFSLVGILLYLLHVWQRVRAWKAAVDTGGSPAPEPAAARRWGILLILGQSIFFLFSSLFFVDILTSHFISRSTAVIWTVVSVILLLAERHESPAWYRSVKQKLPFLILLLILAFLQVPLRAAFPGRIPQVPVFGEEIYSEAPTCTDTLLGSQIKWAESAPQGGRVHVDIRLWTSPALARWVEADAARRLSPVAGYKGAWYLPYKEGYLLQRGQVQLRLTFQGDRQEIPLDTALAWLDSLE